MLERFERVVGPAPAAVGFVGLAAFWVPIFTRKGGGRHVLFAPVFANSAYVTLGLAGVSVIYHMAKLLAQGINPVTDPASFSFLLFLGYLALVPFIDVRHAVGMLHEPASGYDLKKQFGNSLQRFWDANLSQIYTLLSETEQNCRECDPHYPDDLADEKFYSHKTLVLGLRVFQAYVEWCDECMARIEDRASDARASADTTRMAGWGDCA